MSGIASPPEEFNYTAKSGWLFEKAPSDTGLAKVAFLSVS